MSGDDFKCRICDWTCVRSNLSHVHDTCVACYEKCAGPERARIVEWLRQQAVLRRGLRELTAAIERGEHLK